MRGVSNRSRDVLKVWLKVLAVAVVGLAVGLGLGLGFGELTKDDKLDTPTAPISASTTTATAPDDDRKAGDDPAAHTDPRPRPDAGRDLRPLPARDDPRGKARKRGRLIVRVTVKNTGTKATAPRALVLRDRGPGRRARSSTRIRSPKAREAS